MFAYIKNKYQNSPIIQRFAGGTCWSFLAGFSYNLSFLLVGLLLSHILGQYLYGQYGMIRSTINMFIVFSSFALGTTATKYVAQCRFTNKSKTERIMNLSLSIAFVLAFVVFAICMMFSNYIAVTTLHTESLIIPLRIASFMILFLTISGVINGILVGYEEFFLIFKQNIIAVCFLITASAVCSYFFQLNGALIALLIYLFVSLCLGSYYLSKVYKREKIRFSLTGIKQEFHILWKFSLPATLGGLLYTPIIWITNTILVNSNAGYEAMAGLDVIRQWYSAVLFIPMIASRVVLPMLSNFSDKTSHNEYNTILTYSLLVNVGSASLMALLLFLFSDPLLSAYGASFAEFKIPFCIMMIVAVVFVANSVVGQMILSKNLAWWGFLFNMIWAIIFVMLNILFVQKNNLGVFGISLAYLISYSVHTIIQIFFSWIILKSKQ